MRVPILYIFAGLPASGKSTLAKMLAVHSHAAYVQVDTVEQALRDLCDCDVYGEGYELSYRAASDTLSVGVNVVADSCNTIELTRSKWMSVATHIGARFVNIEVVCSDLMEHRRRLETRRDDIKNLPQLSWDSVVNRECDEWLSERIVVDTAGVSESQAFGMLSRMLSELAQIAK